MDKAPAEIVIVGAGQAGAHTSGRRARCCRGLSISPRLTTSSTCVVRLMRSLSDTRQRRRMHRVAALHQEIHYALPAPSTVPRSMNQQECRPFRRNGCVPDLRLACRTDQRRCATQDSPSVETHGGLRAHFRAVYVMSRAVREFCCFEVKPFPLHSPRSSNERRKMRGSARSAHFVTKRPS